MAQKVINQKIKSSNGTEYNINFSTLEGRKALNLKFRLAVVVLPTINGIIKNVGSFFEIVRKSKENKRAIGDPKNFEGINLDFEGIIEKLVQNLGVDQFMVFVDELLEGVTAGDKRSNNAYKLDDPNCFDELFSGDMMLLYKILAVVLEANFGSLFKWGDTGKK